LSHLKDKSGKKAVLVILWLPWCRADIFLKMNILVAIEKAEAGMIKRASLQLVIFVIIP